MSNLQQPLSGITAGQAKIIVWGNVDDGSLWSRWPISIVSSAAEAIDMLITGKYYVLIIASSVRSEDGIEALMLIDEQVGLNCKCIIISSSKADVQKVIGRSRSLYFVCDQEEGSSRLIPLVESALNDNRHDSAESANDSIGLLRLEAHRQTSEEQLTRIFGRMVSETITCSFFHCAFPSSVAQELTIYSSGLSTPRVPRETAGTCGSLGYVARTATSLYLPNGSTFAVEGDPYVPIGGAHFPLYLVPVVSTARRVLAVFIVGLEDGTPSDGQDIAKLEQLASCVRVSLEAIDEKKRLASDLARSLRDKLPSAHIYRQEALEAQAAVTGDDGTALIGLPFWLRYSPLGIAAMFVFVIGVVMLAPSRERVSGPFAIRACPKTAVAMNSSGVVSRVFVTIGDRVHRGDMLVMTDSLSGDPLMSRINAEVRSPVEGTVTDIGVRVGQHVSKEDIAVSVAPPDARNDVLVALPGPYLPQIRPGMSMTLRISGYPNTFEKARIISINEDVVGPQEASRFIGRESSGALATHGPVFVVTGQMSSNTFEDEGLRLHYKDGMNGNADVTISEEPLIETLLPALKTIAPSIRRSLSNAGQ
jgi:biotin carboxyl carrier protein